MDSLLKSADHLKNADQKILKDLIRKNVTLRFVKKGELLQRAGQTNCKGYLVKHGLLKSYSIDEKGKEHIYMFAPEGWVAGDIEAQTFNMPTQLFIEAIEDSEVEVLSVSILSYLPYLSKEILYQEFERLMKRNAVLQRRVIMQMSASAKERYEEFTQTYPKVFNRVPLKMVASYLGITPEALSTIRKELTPS